MSETCRHSPYSAAFSARVVQTLSYIDGLNLGSSPVEI